MSTSSPRKVITYYEADVPAALTRAVAKLDAIGYDLSGRHEPDDERLTVRVGYDSADESIAEIRAALGPAYTVTDTGDSNTDSDGETVEYVRVEAVAEPDVTVEVETESRGVAVLCSDLDELGVPESEQAGVRERAIEAYWAAERAAYLLTPEAERDGL